MSTAVAQILEVVEFCRDRGVAVTFEPGWETRGNGYSASYVGGLVHHTASNSSEPNPCPTRRILIEGRSDLPGPLSQFQTCWDGKLHVIAAHPSNHAGASGGRSMGPLPVTNLFNPLVMGNEIDYSGSVPMTSAQYRTAAIWGAAVATVLAGGDVEYIRAHAETSITGKWDPGVSSGKTIDMARFRADCRQHLSAPQPVPTPEEDLLSAIETAIRFVKPKGKPDVFECHLLTGTRRHITSTRDLTDRAWILGQAKIPYAGLTKVQDADGKSSMRCDVEVENIAAFGVVVS